MSDFTIGCSACDNSTRMQTSASTVSKGRSFDVNRRVVYHSLETGGGYEALSSFCSVMNMPCMSKQAYYKQVDIILGAQESEALAELLKAGERLRNLFNVENDTDSTLGADTNEDSNDPLDVTVSFDGTWAKRGFTSLFGVFFVMSVDTGEVLDYHVFSKFCQKCSKKKNECKDDLEAFEAWKAEHIINGECDINFEGSSPAMEAEAAQVLWSRSIEKHNMRYKFMVSDGDSKAYSAVEDTYDGVKVEKTDCVGHVQKRMGKHLLKLKSSTKGKLDDGKTIGGRGRLTDAKIKQLQRYYGLAIRQNIVAKQNPTDTEVKVAVYTMKKNIIATLSHNVKAESVEAQHRYCPPGANSWCKWRQDKATGTKTYKDDNLLPSVFLDVLRPVFMTLSETNLLGRCVRGATQNRNECINSLVWIRCPKHKFHGRKIVRFAAASAVCHYHGGAASRTKVMERLSTPGGEHTEKSCRSKDRKRVAKSDLQISEKFKRRREGIQQLRTQREEALRDAEGVTNEAGGF